MRAKRIPIKVYAGQYFGCMTIPILFLALCFMFAGAFKRWSHSFGREVRRFVTGV